MSATTNSPQTESHKSGLSHAGSGQPCVVVAEDDNEMRSLIGLTLQQDGYQIVECRDGIELLARLHGPAAGTASKIDLVISDIRMPGTSGLAVLNELSKTDMAPPVILITAFGDSETHAEARRLGAAACLNKPFDLEVLLEHVRAVVPRAGPSGRLSS
ncbi:response regulator [bacterium]|nr:response regulator [bacterium]